jgi:hypothetical protein
MTAPVSEPPHAAPRGGHSPPRTAAAGPAVSVIVSSPTGNRAGVFTRPKGDADHIVSVGVAGLVTLQTDLPPPLKR